MAAPRAVSSCREWVHPSETTSMNAGHIEIPRLRALSRHAGRHLLEATFVPLVIFYSALWSVGIWWGLAAALAWSYSAIVVRLATGRRVPGLLLLGALGITARTIIALSTGSVFVYFLQPTIGTVGVAGLFLLSLSTRRPMAERLAADFCPLSSDFYLHPPVRRFFVHITLLWAFVQLSNAAITMTLLVSQPVQTFLWTRSVTSVVLTGGAIALSTWWFKRSMRRHGFQVIFAAA